MDEGCNNCAVQKQLDELKEKQYRIDHDLLKGPVSTFMGLGEMLILYTQLGRIEEAKKIAEELIVTGQKLKDGISQILSINVINSKFK